MHTILRRQVFPGLSGLRGTGPLKFTGLFSRAIARVFETLLIWQERASQRHALAQLDDRMLKDVGLNRADVELEANKPFWRV
jgi:uncharacterized protein YjiS (DUF1127 family)